MKLTPVQAATLLYAELKKGNGAYINSRFFKARVFAGVLQVSYDCKTWGDVPAGSEFRTYWNSPMFTYEPVTTGKHLTVVWANGLVNDLWEETFRVGNEFEITRETPTQYIISPLGFDIRIAKASLLTKGFRPGNGVEFKVTEAAQVEETPQAAQESPQEAPGDAPVIAEPLIKAFIQGYLTAALWSSTDNLPPRDGFPGETVNLDDYEWADGEPEKLHGDCRDFIQANATDLLEYADKRAFDPSQGTIWEYAGHDFWLTRNGHGAGYWDRGLGELGDRLSKASKVYGGIDLYLGDGELVYSGV